MASPAPVRGPSYTQSYGVDIFISYGHIDNQENWISEFHRRLETRLQELLGTQELVVWRDLKLDGTDAFEDQLQSLISSSAVFISVLSPRYTSSSSCRKELEWFLAAAQATGSLRVDLKSRLIKVTKTRLLDGMAPADFKDTLGFEFYETDSNKQLFHEFDAQPNMPRFIQFRDQCDRLAQAVQLILRKLRRVSSVEASARRTIFLARTTSDLERQRNSIHDELVDHGHTVLAPGTLPDSGPEVRAAIEELLLKSEFSVHLVGRSYGLIPEQETLSLGELQYELACAQRQRPSFQQLVWIPKDLQNPEDRQKAFLTRLRDGRDQPDGHQGDLNEGSLEEFKSDLLQLLSRKLEVPANAPGAKAKAVYLVCNHADLNRDQLIKIKGYLRSRGHPVELPPFEGDPDELRTLEEQLIGDTDAALIYYGSAKDAWVIAKRKNLRKVLGSKPSGRDYARALYLCVPRDERKADYLSVPDHLFLEPEPGFPPLLVLGDCEDFDPSKLEGFIQLIEKER